MKIEEYREKNREVDKSFDYPSMMIEREIEILLTQFIK